MRQMKNRSTPRQVSPSSQRAKSAYHLKLREQEMEDLLSAVGMAIRVAKQIHKDSPNFRRALDRLNKKLWKTKRRTK